VVGVGIHGSLGLSDAAAIKLICARLVANTDSYHSVVSSLTNHPVSFAEYSSGAWEGGLHEAARLEIPRFSVDELSSYWERRQREGITVSKRTSLATGSAFV
jgi:hypothetical protein